MGEGANAAIGLIVFVAGIASGVIKPHGIY